MSSWLKQLAETIFPNNYSTGKLPLAPSVMASGSPWYEESSPTKEEVKRRIKKDICVKDPRLKTIPLLDIINGIVDDATWINYRGYYTFLHTNFVTEGLELAVEQYEERHQKNMRLFYIIATLKPKMRKVVQRFRNRRRMRYWANENNVENN